MKSQRERAKTRTGARVVLGIALGVLILIAALTHSSFSLSRTPVFVLVLTNLPTVVAPFGANQKSVRVAVPYSQAKDKLINETEIDQIKKTIPWTKTTLLLYHPSYIQVESSNSARLLFKRGGKFIMVTMRKTDKGWQSTEIYSAAKDYSVTPPDFWDRISDALPF